MYEAERGLFELQRGRPLLVTTGDGCEPTTQAVLVATVEGLRIPTLERLGRLGEGRLRLAVTGHRARAMGLVEAATATRVAADPGGGLSVGLRPEVDPDEILRLSSATGRYREGLNVREASPQEMAGLALARLGRLLPAIVSVPAEAAKRPELRDALSSGSVLTATTAQIAEMAANTRVEVIHVSDSPVPLEGAEDAHFMFFREASGILEHVAILIGHRQDWPDPVPVRLHSACLTGDLFGSLRCDCGEQLRGSLRVFAEGGGGVLLYLAQEGRGIGLGNKLRAYVLQQEGLDSVDADCTLGFGADERRYDAAVAMLRHLEIDRIQLLTNNPEKVRAVREGGIQVLDRQPLYGTLNRHNLPYVRTKVLKAGHWLGDMLSGAVSGK